MYIVLYIFLYKLQIFFNFFYKKTTSIYEVAFVNIKFF